MEKIMKFLSFWAINDDLNIERLKEQLSQMKGVGLAGTIFHPRYYTGRPPYMGKECPHHYLEGDYRLTSPMHYQGNKHFGDEDDAPDHTHVPCYHFVKFGIGG